MDLYSAFPYLLTIAIIIISLCKPFHRKHHRSPAIKGRIGERKVNRQLKKLKKRGYVILNDVLLRRKDGNTTQIDHIAIGPTGVFVIETKNRRGRVEGDENMRYWHIDGHPFYNPVYQNKGHIDALNEVIDDPTIPFSSMVVFSNKADIDDVKKYGVYIAKEFLSEFYCQVGRVLSDKRISEIADIINKANDPTRKTRREHIRAVNSKARHERRCQLIRICPQCGGHMDIFRRDGHRYYSCPDCGYNSLLTQKKIYYPGK